MPGPAAAPAGEDEIPAATEADATAPSASARPAKVLPARPMPVPPAVPERWPQPPADRAGATAVPPASRRLAAVFPWRAAIEPAADLTGTPAAVPDTPAEPPARNLPDVSFPARHAAEPAAEPGADLTGIRAAVPDTPAEPRLAVAFSARLVPVPPAGPEHSPPPAAVPPPAEPAASYGDRDEAHPAPRIRKSAAGGNEPEERTAGAPADPAPEASRTPVPAAGAALPDTQVVDRRAAEPPAAPDPAPAPHAAGRPAAPERAVQEPVARDIRLELGGNGNRVEVRLQERAGEVRLAVRTPDAALAESLRDHLPSLSDRLEQSGFRADQWRAGEAAGSLRPLEVGNSVRSTQGFRQHAGGNQGQGSPRDPSQERQQPQRGAARDRIRNQKGREFAWLLSTRT
jgi:hypothetical protein